MEWAQDAILEVRPMGGILNDVFNGTNHTFEKPLAHSMGS
jgi:hypothetical protein